MNAALQSTDTFERRQPNRYRVLENGDAYFPAVFAAIAEARREVFIETFILFEDSVGKQLQACVIAAAQRGVRVHLTVDGYGSPDLSKEFMEKLASAGVRFHIYDPCRRILGMRVNLFRRLHRKIVSVDGVTAFIGGINYGEDHLLSYGAEAKQDYAVRIDGPLAAELHEFARDQAAAYYRQAPWWRRSRRMRMRSSSANAMLVVRDNQDHRDDIERQYQIAVRSAKHEIIIACAYFFPGYRFLRQLRRAARRGVKVKLILQGVPDMPHAQAWASMLYPSLLDGGVEIYEYTRRPLHAKVTVIDRHWSTVGSSNLDPLSLALNLEANVIVRDPDLNQELRSYLEPLLAQHCRRVSHANIPRSTLWRILCSVVAYHGTRHFPRLAGWLPAHLPKLHSVEPQDHAQLPELSPDFGGRSDSYRH